MKKVCFITTSRADFGMIEILINYDNKKFKDLIFSLGTLR